MNKPAIEITSEHAAAIEDGLCLLLDAVSVAVQESQGFNVSLCVHEPAARERVIAAALENHFRSEDPTEEQERQQIALRASVLRAMLEAMPNGEMELHPGSGRDSFIVLEGPNGTRAYIPRNTFEKEGE